MKKPKRPGRTTTRTVIFVPDRKLSESILEFAEPILEPLGPLPDLERARRALDLAVGVWNFHAMATPVWGKPHFLAEARAQMERPGEPPELAMLFESLLERRRALYGNDYRVVGEWTLGPDGAGGFSLRCDARLPNGYEAAVPPPARARIAIGGRFLDDVKISKTETSRLSFPVTQHHVSENGALLTVETPAYIAVQLFAEGALSPIRSTTVEVAIHGEPARAMVLVEVRAGEHLPKHAADVVALTFEAAAVS